MVFAANGWIMSIDHFPLVFVRKQTYLRHNPAVSFSFNAKLAGIVQIGRFR